MIATPSAPPNINNFLMSQNICLMKLLYELNTWRNCMLCKRQKVDGVWSCLWQYTVSSWIMEFSCQITGVRSQPIRKDQQN